MKEDVPYFFQTKMRVIGKSELLKQIREYEKKFEMSAKEFHERFLEGDLQGKDAQMFSDLCDLYIQINGKL